MTNLAQMRAGLLLAQYNVVAPPTPDALVYFLSKRLQVKTRTMPDDLPGLLARGEVVDVIWLRQQDQPGRRRFTLWHEAGHYLMHNGVSYCLAKSMRQLQTEREADIFATAMLMPEPWIRRDLVDGWRGTAILAGRYAVSQLAMSRRLRELGVA